MASSCNNLLWIILALTVLMLPQRGWALQAFETEANLIVNLPTHSLTIKLPDEFKGANSYRMVLYPQPGLYAPGFSSNSDPEMLMRWATSLFQKGQLDEALQHLMEAERLDRSNPQIKNMLGSLFYKMEKYDEATNYWKLSLSLNPNQAKVKQFLNKIKDMGNKARPVPKDTE